MKIKNSLFLCLFCVISAPVWAAGDELPLFATAQEKVTQEQGKTATSSRQNNRIPNVGKRAVPVDEIKIAPKPFPSIKLDATEIPEVFETPAVEEKPVTQKIVAPQTPVQSIEIKPVQKEKPVAATLPKPVARKVGVSAAAVPVIDVEKVANFDVVGIKLGMDADEVSWAAKDSGFDVANMSYAIPLFMTTDFHAACRADGFFQGRLLDECTRKKAESAGVYYVSEMTLKNSTTKEEVTVYFTSPLSDNDAYKIDYTSFGDNSLGTSFKDTAKKTTRRDMFWRLVAEKYGRPDIAQKIMWGNPDTVYMQAYMLGNALDGHIVLEDKRIFSKDWNEADKVNAQKERSHAFSFAQESD